MLEITSIKNGLVIDHIKAGMGVKIFNYLNLDKVDNQVALIINAESKKNKRKDIIKIEDLTEVNYTVLALLSPGITINVIKEEQIIEKIKPELPKEVTGILKCQNARCITSQEKYLPHTFELLDRDKDSYKCIYCDTIINPSEVENDETIN